MGFWHREDTWQRLGRMPKASDSPESAVRTISRSAYKLARSGGMKTLLPLLLLASLLGCRTNESPEAQVDDLQIMTQVKATLASDIGPSSVTNISANSTNGVLKLP